MIAQVAAAIERKDYRTAASLLKQLLKESPENPWVQFYVGRLHEATDKRNEAQNVYRQLLRGTTNAKIVAQARQGLGRLEAIEKEERLRAIAQATSDPSDTQLGVLVLEPIANQTRTTAAQNFARIMQLDPYSARLLLPSRGWRLYRTGAVGELKFYGQQLDSAAIPCFWATVAEVQKIRVFQVNYFESVTPQAIAVCRNEGGQIGSLAFNWSEVRSRVAGLLPIFETVVDVDHQRKLQRKTQTQDYAHFCDLHLPQRRCILRLHNNSYQFQQGVLLTPDQNKTTLRINWNNLLSFLDRQLPNTAVWSDFTAFAQTALDQTELLDRIQSHIHLFRREPTAWDSAFQLYSGLVFSKNAE